MAAIQTAFVFAVLCIASSMQTEFQTCGSGKPAPSAVRLNGCEKLPCNLVRGNNAEAFIDFSPLAGAKSLKAEVEATVLGVTAPYPLPQPEACKDITSGSCPLNKGDVVTYHLKMPVEKSYPKVSLTIQLSLVDPSNKNVITCFRIPAKVID